MQLPPRPFHTICDVAQRWNVTPADIVGWAIDGHLDLTIAAPPVRTYGRTFTGLAHIEATHVLSLFLYNGSRLQTVAIQRLRHRDTSRDWIWITDPEEGIPVRAGDILITRPELERFEATRSLSGCWSEREAKTPASNAGRPTDYDWDAFEKALSCRTRHDDGVPKSQGELVREMMAWFSERDVGDVPDERTIRRRVQAFLKERQR